MVTFDLYIMSCVICNALLGDSYVLLYQHALHLECRDELIECNVCFERLYNSNAKSCLSCGFQKKYTCDMCHTLISRGSIFSGRLLCQKCLSRANDKKMERDELKKTICQKCGTKKQKITVTQCYGITAAEYEVEIMQCPKCQQS
jgi:hypothetical protein